MFRSDLLVDKGVKVEHNTLEMDRKDFGTLIDACQFRHVSLLATEVAFVVVNELPQDESVEGLLECFGILHLQCDRIECLNHFFGLRTLVAIEEVSH